MALEQSPQVSSSLDRKKYCALECTAAIQGNAVPEALGLPLTRLCVIRGIRHHDGYAHHLRGVSSDFTRALNARDIMSDRIPVMRSSDEYPYCIWHPDVASEETYREVAHKYPSMKYQVGRACAVAGYYKLYQELDLLPEVHIAEEARESGNFAIFEDIMSKRKRYSIMDDYGRSINTNDPQEGHMNGDTAVRASLEVKQRYRETSIPIDGDDGEEILDLFGGPGYDTNPFNITEDMNIDVSDSEDPCYTARHDVAHGELLLELLTSPLPVDLPTVDKDLLICMAAYHGDLDRYARLRRPFMVPGELHSCVRGIYHTTMFAVWWSKQDHVPHESGYGIREAVVARFIMNNSLSKAPSSLFCDTSYLIWYPNVAARSTYAKLAELSPRMLPQILRACIVANYQTLFDTLMADNIIIPDDALLGEAGESYNPHYKSCLEAQIEAVGKKEMASCERWKLNTHRNLMYRCNNLYKTAGFSTADTWDSLYNGYGCNAYSLELLACLPAEWRIPEGEIMCMNVDYVNWPVQKTGNK